MRKDKGNLKLREKIWTGGDDGTVFTFINEAHEERRILINFVYYM